MANTVLVSNKIGDLQQLTDKLATDPTVQAILLKDVFTREVNIVSGQTGKNNTRQITQPVVDANRGDVTLETTGFTSKEDAYIDIAVGLGDIMAKATSTYASVHNIKPYKTNYSPRIHTPSSCNTMGWASVGFLNASVVFKGEDLHTSHYCEPAPESGDVLIVKAYDSIDHGNNRDNLMKFSYNSQKSKATSVGLSMVSFKI